MSEILAMTGQELKAIVLDERARVLCQNCQYRYCPTYECNLVDKAKALSYKQFDNIAKIVKAEDAFIELPSEIMKRRVKHENK